MLNQKEPQDDCGVVWCGAAGCLLHPVFRHHHEHLHRVSAERPDGAVEGPAPQYGVGDPPRRSGGVAAAQVEQPDVGKHRPFLTNGLVRNRSSELLAAPLRTAEDLQADGSSEQAAWVHAPRQPPGPEPPEAEVGPNRSVRPTAAIAARSI